MGGANEALELKVKRAIDMGTRLALKIQERGEGAVNTGRHVFVPKARAEERMIEFLKSFAGGKKY